MFLYSAVVGSNLHGTATENSDVDHRSVFRLLLRDMLSVQSEPKKTLKAPNGDNVSYELTHFARMLSKCNPTSVEVVFGTKKVGDAALMHKMWEAAMDTELYTSQCMGMVRGLAKPGAPAKAFYHAARISVHLDKYLAHGVLAFNVGDYGKYADYLMDLKQGYVPFDETFLEHKEVGKHWHTANLDALDRLVYNEYTKPYKEVLLYP